MYPQLYQAIENALAQGVPPRYISYGLIQAGWPAVMVNDALDAYLASHGQIQHTTAFSKWLKKYHRQAVPGVIIMVVLNTIASGIALLRPWPIKILADSAFGDIPAPGPLQPFTHTATLILLMSLLTLAIFLVGSLFDLIKDRVLIKIGFWLNRNIKEESFRHILHLPLYHQERLSKGDYIYRQNTVTNSLSDLVLGSTSNILESIILIIGVLVIMVNLHVTLTIISVVLIPFLFLAIKLIGPKLGELGRQLAELASKTASHITESIDNAETVQAFTLEEQKVAKLNTFWEEGYKLSLKSMMWGKLFNFSNGLLVILGTAAVMFYGGNQVLQNQLSIGQLLIFLTYMGYLLGPVQEIADQITSRRQKLIDVHRVYEVLTDHENIENLRSDKHMPKVTGQIEFQNVTYAYDDQLVLQNVNLTIKAGEKVGIIGPSGAGKSTALKLLPLFITPNSGKIFIDGIDTQSVSMHDLRRNIAWISQAPQLFSESITNNIIDGDIFRQVVAQEVGYAAQAANLPEFVDKLPLRYNSPAGENGSSLSGGQKQRIAIARAFLKNSPIICMDEPTSALDHKSESLIRDSLNLLIQNKTVLLVTHRPSLLVAMDTIYVLENYKLRNVNDYGGYEKYTHYLQAHEQI